MRIKLFAAGAAIALAATIGSASAADQFSTLEGIAVDALTPQEMRAVAGADDLTVRLPFSVGGAPDATPGVGPEGTGGVGAPFIGGGPESGSVPTGNICDCTLGDVAKFTPVD